MKRSVNAVMLVLLTVFIISCATQTPRRSDNGLQTIRNSSLGMISASIDVNKLLSPNDTDDVLLQKTMDRLRETFKDPDSAKFKNVKVVHYGDGRFACGEVNAKNSMGGYVGYKPFIGDFVVDVNKLSGIKRKRSTEFYNKAVDAYFAGYNRGCK